MTKLLTDPSGFPFSQLAHSELCRVGENLKGVPVSTHVACYDVASGGNPPCKSSSCPMEWAQGNAKVKKNTPSHHALLLPDAIPLDRHDSASYRNYLHCSSAYRCYS